MTRIDEFVIRRTGRSARGQGGYMLLIALGLMLTSTVIIVALLSLTMNSTSVLQKQKTSSRQGRAADSALETALNQIRMDPTGALASTTPCDPGVTSIPIDGVTAEVTCEVQPSDPTAPQVPSTSSGSTNALKLVGSTYAGGVTWRTDCAPGATGPGCFPWKTAIGAPNYGTYGSALSSVNATLVHSGPQPLRVAGGVQVKGGAAVLRNPTSSSPGLEVGGEYVQGAAGLFSAQGGGTCGLLGFTHPWNVGAARVGDLTNGPECANSLAAAMGDANGLAAPANQFAATPNANAWMSIGSAANPVKTAAQTAPACSGTVLTFQPGSYNKNETARINGYLASNADGCDNRTFWFKPGDYWFDSANADNSLTIADSSAFVIFGAPSRAAITTSGAAASDFPQACDPAVAGVSITLSPRTSLRHSAGRVAVCDRTAGATNSGASPAIWQTSSADGGWTGLPGNIPTLTARSRTFWTSNYSNYTGTNPNGAKRAGDGSEAAVSISCSLLQFCEGDIYLTATGMGQTNTAGGAGADPGSAPIDWAQVLVTSNSLQSNDMETFAQAPAATQIVVYLRNPATGVTSSTASCGGQYQSINESPNGSNTLAYDLLQDPPASANGLPSCRSMITDRAQLYNARIDVNLHINSKCWSCSYGATFDGVAIRTGWSVTSAGAATGTMENADGARLPNDGSVARFRNTCSFWVWDDCPTGWASLVMTDLDNLQVPNLPTSTLTSAGVAIKGAESNDGTWGLTLDAYPEIWNDSKIKLTLTNLAGGGTCAVVYPRTPAWNQTVYYDLMNASATQDGSTARCATVLNNSKQLVGATLQVDLYLDRDGWAALDDFGQLIDYVGITTTSGPYTRPTSINTITSNATASGAGASFNSYGAVSTSRNDLDVHWTGPATAAPIVTGDLVLSALGSDMAPTAGMGTLCCSPMKPSERRVVLRAKVEGNLRATALVRISDQQGGSYNPGRTVTVEDWRLCNSPGTATVCPDP